MKAILIDPGDQSIEYVETGPSPRKRRQLFHSVDGRAHRQKHFLFMSKGWEGFRKVGSGR